MLHKGEDIDDVDDVNNYHSISSLSVFSKMLEKNGGQTTGFNFRIKETQLKVIDLGRISQ